MNLKLSLPYDYDVLGCTIVTEDGVNMFLRNLLYIVSNDREKARKEA
jgi:hypothetical protein